MYIYIYITITEQLGEGEVCRIRSFQERFRQKYQKEAEKEETLWSFFS